jgi:hypothetical protein
MRCHAAKAGGKSWVKTLEVARSPPSGLTGLEPIECPLISPEPYSGDNHLFASMSGRQISHKLVLQEYTLEAINAIGVATAWDLESDDLQAGGLCRGTLTFIR